MKKIYISRNDLFRNLNMVLFNNITEVDEDFITNNFELFENPCQECDGSGEVKGKQCEECGGEGYHELEAYQYFAVEVSDYDIKRLKEYGVEIGYSEELNLHIMPIYDFGTSWSAFSYSKEVPDNYILSPDETITRQTVY